MEHIFLEFLNRSIAAGWVVLAVIFLRQLLKRAPKWIHCLLWALVAFRLACPFSLESVFSLIPSRETVRHDMSVSSEPVIDSGISFVDNTVNQVIRQPTAPRPETSMNPLQIWLFAASVIWILGIAAMLLYALVAYARLWLKIRMAVRLEGEVMLSQFVDTPFLLGVIRPRIYLPSRMPKELRAPVIAHELAHLRRQDNLWKILGFTLLAAYWFQPLCWAAYILFGRDIELACDEKVIRDYDTNQKRLYSEALLACSMGGHAAFVCPLAFGEVGVKERIKSVLHYRKPAFWATVAAVVACVVAVFCFLTDPVKGEDGSGGAALAGADSRSGADIGTDGTPGAGTRTEGNRQDDDAGTERNDSANDAAIPKDYTVDVVTRFMRMDWNEIRSRNLPVIDGSGFWEDDVVCIAEIPEEDIRIYGYNDEELTGEGVAIEIEDNVNYFDWFYRSQTSSHYRIPQCYWNRTARQLQVALNSYVGPNASAYQLHVLQYDGTGTLSDNEFDIIDYWDMLKERIYFRFQEETGQLTLFDAGNQKELITVTVEQGVVKFLELGNRSRFLLGERIVLQLAPGYYAEGGYYENGMAEYPKDTPLLEADVLMEERDGKILFSLGEIRVVDSLAEDWL